MTMEGKTMEKNIKLAIMAALAIVALVIFSTINPMVIVHPGQRGVVIQLGAVQDAILGEGIHFVMPITQSVKKIDVQIQKVEVPSEASSKDLQLVHANVALNYHLDALKVNKIYQTVGDDIAGRIIAPAIQEYLKKSTAMFTAEELISKREIVKEEFRRSLAAALVVNYVVVDNVFITNFEFSKEFNHAIEQKVTAEQEALMEKNNLAKVKFLAEQKIATATADAKAIEIQAKAVTSQGGKDYVQLKAIEKWDGHLPTQMIPGSAVPFIDLTKSKN
jgi:regulator of protease activity HflC (stomatin/prohibitin superfamily)